MLFFGGGLGVIVFALWVFCVIDVITTPADRCRNLPKLAWIFIVILLLDIGAVLWLVAGRQWNRSAGAGPARTRPTSSFGPVPRTGGPRRVATNPDDDDEFLAGLAARAEEQRRRARDLGSGDQPAGEDS
jgi:hypothetical protein